jgi:hypothetical protein
MNTSNSTVKTGIMAFIYRPFFHSVYAPIDPESYKVGISLNPGDSYDYINLIITNSDPHLDGGKLIMLGDTTPIAEFDFDDPHFGQENHYT